MTGVMRDHGPRCIRPRAKGNDRQSIQWESHRENTNNHC
eukprot:CAMPEP_0194340182 /NCGR_PEP_ID=MMETSP0171-20130528/85488_1 /TAXON_ID=218684 /ORGANISM="Corethron pennatum, Strain L29A3" /LENGTH=38 /DNA_ID= /DNA_START= /DNA_END= /DNA_ORIENTATION=